MIKTNSNLKCNDEFGKFSNIVGNFCVVSNGLFTKNKN